MTNKQKKEGKTVIGPHGEIRPADDVANAILVAKIATGEAEEQYVDKESTKRCGVRKHN